MALILSPQQSWRYPKSGTIRWWADALPFQHTEEALGASIVGTAPNTTYAVDQIVPNREALLLTVGK